MRASDFFYCIPFLGIVFLYVFLWKKNRKRRRSAEGASEPIDYDVLNEAEQVAARQGSLLERYTNMYVPIGKFSTTQAFSEQGMERVVAELAKIQIESRYLFIETMPAGAITGIGPAGYFQIWVDPNDERKARELLNSYFGREV